MRAPLEASTSGAALPRVAVIGTGGMGTLCAKMLAERGSAVVLWGRTPEHVGALRRDRENRRHLPGASLPSSIRFTHESEAVFEDRPVLAISAVPCQYMRSVWARLGEALPAGTPVLSVAKGIEVETLRYPTEIVRECVGDVPVACLSGPNIAPEIAAKKPAGAVVASADTALAERIQRGFSSSYFRVYTSNDVLGVELAGAVKNVIALAAGICDGLALGDNAKAGLVARGLAEIRRLGAALGARPETLNGLAGVGDLITTCVSKMGRNRSAGERIGQGVPVGEVVAETSSVVEGIATTRSVLELAGRAGIELPIVEGVGAVLFDGRDPLEVLEGLMTRPLRAE